MIGTLFGFLIGMGLILFITGLVDWLRGGGPWGLRGLLHWLLSVACFSVALITALLMMCFVPWVMI